MAIDLSNHPNNKITMRNLNNLSKRTNYRMTAKRYKINHYSMSADTGVANSYATKE